MKKAEIMASEGQKVRIKNTSKSKLYAGKSGKISLLPKNSPWAGEYLFGFECMDCGFGEVSYDIPASDYVSMEIKTYYCYWIDTSRELSDIRQAQAIEATSLKAVRSKLYRLGITTTVSIITSDSDIVNYYKPRKHQRK